MEGNACKAMDLTPILALAVAADDNEMRRDAKESAVLANSRNIAADKHLWGLILLVPSFFLYLYL